MTTIKLLLPVCFLLTIFGCDKENARPTSISPITEWTESTIVADQDLTDIDFHDASFGVVCGTTGTLLKTEDAGLTWQSLKAGTNSSLLAIDVLDRQHFYTARIGVYGTEDGGANFRQLGDLEDAGSSIFDLHFFSPTEGIILKNGNIYRTTDGGVNWEERYTEAYTANRFAVTDNTTVYASGGYTSDRAQNGAVYKSTDNGVTWRQLTLPQELATTQIMSIDFVNDQSGYVGTFTGEIFKTTDGGEVWTKAGNVDNGLISDLKFESTALGYLLSGDEIFHTSDAGTTWTSVYTASQELFRLARTSDNHYYVIGGNGLLVAG